MSQRRKEKCKWKQDVGKDIMKGRVENVVESDWKKKFSVGTLPTNNGDNKLKRLICS